MIEINTKTYKIAFGQSGYSLLNSLIENNKYSKVSVLVDDNTKKFCLDVFKQIINIITDIELLRFISYKHFLWIIIIPPIASFCYQLDGIFIGATETKSMRDCMIISVSLYIIISLFFSKVFNNHGIWISVIFLMILRSVTLYFSFKRIMRKF